MDRLRGHHDDEARLEMYRRTAAEALAEIDELHTEILAAQASVTAKMSRVRALENLVGAVRDLLGPSVELPVNLRPVRIEGLSDAEPLPLRRRDRVRLPANDEPPDGVFEAARYPAPDAARYPVPEAAPYPAEPAASDGDGRAQPAEVFDAWRAAGLRRP